MHKGTKLTGKIGHVNKELKAKPEDISELLYEVYVSISKIWYNA